MNEHLKVESMQAIIRMMQELDQELPTIIEFYADACKTLEVKPTFEGFKHWVQAAIESK